MKIKLQPLRELIADAQSGFAIGEKDPNGVIQVRMNNVDTGGHLSIGAQDDVRRVPASKHQIENYSLIAGDVLFNNTNSTELVGKTALFEGHDEVVLFSNHYTRIRTKPDALHPKFLAYWFNTLWRKSVFANLCNSWVNQSAIKKEILLKVEIPVLPLAEQRRIAAILDKADGIRRKREESLKLADEFLRSVFLEMFGDPVTNPKGWKEQQLHEVADIASGVTKGKNYIGKKTVQVPYMRVASVQDGYLKLDDITNIEVTPEEVERYRLISGDLLLTEGGDPDKLGRGAIWKGEIKDCIHQNHIFRVRSNASQILPEFLSALVGSSRGKAYFLRAAKQTTGIASINMTQLRAFPALVPPIKRQTAFVTAVERYRVTKRMLETQGNLASNLFHSLVQRAFRGEL